MICPAFIRTDFASPILVQSFSNFLETSPLVASNYLVVMLLWLKSASQNGFNAFKKQHFQVLWPGFPQVFVYDHRGTSQMTPWDSDWAGGTEGAENTGCWQLELIWRFLEWWVSINWRIWYLKFSLICSFVMFNLMFNSTKIENT